MSPLRAFTASSRLFVLLLSVLSLWGLAAMTGCNGGGNSQSNLNSSSNPSPNPTSTTGDATDRMTGVAAVGRALDGYVYVQDVTGAIVNAPIAADGRYQVDITGMLAPFIVRVVASDASVWYSYAPSRVPANVSQLSTLVLFLANGKGPLATLFDHWPQQWGLLTANEMLHAQAVVNLNFAAQFQQHGLDPTRYNLFTAPFTPDGTGFDAVLDAIGPISFGDGRYQFANPVHQATFDETIPVTDQEITGSLGWSFTLRADPPRVLDSIVVIAPPTGEIVWPGPIEGGSITGPPPLPPIGYCPSDEHVCAEGESCPMTECPPVSDTGHAGGFVSGSVSATPVWP